MDWCTHAAAGDQTHSLGTCCDRGSNLQPSGVRDDAQPTEPPGHGPSFVPHCSSSPSSTSSPVGPSFPGSTVFSEGG